MKIPLRHLISLFLLGILIFISVSVCSSISLQVKNSNFQQPSTECRVVKHSMGETCIPKNPERVITIFHDTLGNSLGIKPIDSGAVGVNNPVPAYLQNEANPEVLSFLEKPIWSNLKAVKTKQIYRVNWTFGGAMGANRIIDDLFKYLVKTS